METIKFRMENGHVVADAEFFGTPTRIVFERRGNDVRQTEGRVVIGSSIIEDQIKPLFGIAPTAIPKAQIDVPLGYPAPSKDVPAYWLAKNNVTFGQVFQAAKAAGFAPIGVKFLDRLGRHDGPTWEFIVWREGNRVNIAERASRRDGHAIAWGKSPEYPLDYFPKPDKLKNEMYRSILEMLRDRKSDILICDITDEDWIRRHRGE